MSEKRRTTKKTKAPKRSKQGPPAADAERPSLAAEPAAAESDGDLFVEFPSDASTEKKNDLLGAELQGSLNTRDIVRIVRDDASHRWRLTLGS